MLTKLKLVPNGNPWWADMLEDQPFRHVEPDVIEDVAVKVWDAVWNNVLPLDSPYLWREHVGAHTT